VAVVLLVEAVVQGMVRARVVSVAYWLARARVVLVAYRVRWQVEA